MLNCLFSFCVIISAQGILWGRGPAAMGRLQLSLDTSRQVVCSEYRRGAEESFARLHVVVPTGRYRLNEAVQAGVAVALGGSSAESASCSSG